MYQQNKSNLQVEKVAAFITEWLKDYALNAKVNGFVVGVSGGIDSAVTSTLCALTGLETHCFELPIHQPPTHVTRARQHMQQLADRYPNVSTGITDLTDTFETLKKALPQDADAAKLNLALANTRARLRMTSLYFHAGVHGCLVAGTGNKVEDFGVGFYTKYGDGGVDLSPIADLMKSEVYALGKFLNVPDSILNAAPSDGLFHDDRTDEDQLGASYDELEWAMQMDEAGKTLEAFEGREREVFNIFKRLNLANKHKMEHIPVCMIPTSLR